MLYSTPTDISAKTTHDLWVEARQFEIDIDRPTSTSIRLTVRYPKTLAIVDGLVLLLNTKPIDATQHPSDGTQYVPSTDYNAPADTINGAKVVAFYSGILNQPAPALETSPESAYVWFETIVENTSPSQLYYASIHPATNVLQYYPIGIQTYPIDTEDRIQSTSTYTGNIPTLPMAPTDPARGMVYFDEQLNVVQYWTGTQWIPTRSDSIASGEYNPGVLGQVYFLTSENKLQVFNGRAWVAANSTNFQFRIGTTWAPIGKQSSLLQAPNNPAVGDFYYNHTSQRAQYWDGSTWVYPTSSTTLFFEGEITTPAFSTPMTVEPSKLFDPYVGQLFYNSSQHKLMVFSGTDWIQANTDQQGVTTSEKVSIGDDGSYDERMRLIKVLQGQLGWPQYCVELKEEQFNIAIDNALDNYRQLSAGAYRMEYLLFTLIPSQQRYYLNNPQDRTNRIVDVSKIHRLNYGGVLPSHGPQDVWSQYTAQNLYNQVGPGGDLLSTFLSAQYQEQLQLMFAGNYTFLWDEPSRELLLTRRVSSSERVIIECFTERSGQEIMTDRWSRQFIQNWALAEAKMILGMIRSKYSSGTPGAQGAITLNGEMLVSEARQDMTELKEELLNYEFGGHTNQGNVSFLFG